MIIPRSPYSSRLWLVFFVSKRPNRSGLYLVGWYEDAKFEGTYTTWPDADDLGADLGGGKFSYTVSSDKAYMIPLPLRTMKFKGSHLRSFAYLRRNGDNDEWRQVLARKLISFRKKLIRSIKENSTDGPITIQGAWGLDAERRKLIEKTAVKAVIKHYSGWKCESKEEQNLGYDLLFKKQKTGEELHAEVKGTSLGAQCFFISKKGYDYARELSDKIEIMGAPVVEQVEVGHALGVSLSFKTHLQKKPWLTYIRFQKWKSYSRFIQFNGVALSSRVVDT